MTLFPEELADRYHRFKYRHFQHHFEHYQALAAHGQSPQTMIVSCCDSRVDPESIFSAMPGELFIMRNVANLIPPFETGGKYHGVSAAMEFAVLNLRIKHLVVMGHSSCGGVKAALDHTAAKETEGHFISKWMSMLDEARLKVLASHQGCSQCDVLHALEREGIKNSLKNLRSFDYVADLENRGKLGLYGAHFDIATGTLSALNEKTGEFLPI